jgi:hypothetical protein
MAADCIVTDGGTLAGESPATTKAYAKPKRGGAEYSAAVKVAAVTKHIADQEEHHNETFVADELTHEASRH